MTTTPNLGLTKDGETDLYSVIRVNANSDKIDEFAGNINEEVGRKAYSADLAAVATSGSFGDLSNVPEIDAAPTEDSTNAVQSGGVFAALGAKAAVGDIYGSGTILSASSENPVDLDDITTVGRYQCGQSASAYVSHRPISQNLGFALTVTTNGLASRYRQTVYLNSDSYAGVYYERYYTSNGWTVWYRFAGEAVT